MEPRHHIRRTAPRGFTLIELLVSMTILFIIVLIVGRIFQQSSVAWESGSRMAEVNITGRALVDYMAQQISGAVDDGDFLEPMLPPTLGDQITFTVLHGTGSSRQAQYITFAYATKTVSRYCGDYGAISYSDPPTGDPRVLATGIVDCNFTASPGWDPSEGLPEYVDVLVSVLSEDDDAKGFAGRTRTFVARAWLLHRNRYRLGN